MQLLPLTEQSVIASRSDIVIVRCLILFIIIALRTAQLLILHRLQL